jgi:Family of unknown function (DUF6496)
MPEKETIERAQEDAREGKSPSTQAGEFVREEMHHIREGKHGASSPQQAIAIGLSKARRAGVKLQPPSRGRLPRNRVSRRNGIIKEDRVTPAASHRPNALKPLVALSREKVTARLPANRYRSRRTPPRGSAVRLRATGLP